MTRSWAVVGGAGFIGSHFVRRLLKVGETSRVLVYDNMSSGRLWHLETVLEDPRLQIIEADVKELGALTDAVVGIDTVIHLASNPDIAKAATEPDVDFWEGTYLTQNVVEACRRSRVRRLLYASGSGVYGDIGEVAGEEDRGPNIPTSTYGASKLAGEALIASYCFMFGLTARAFRFGNVVGPNQTHGVGFDFVRRLLADSTALAILGDGRQSKSYIHVDDVIEAVLTADRNSDEAFVPFNVATGDYITVTEIADLAVEIVGLDRAAVRFEFTGGDRGWKGDVPIVRLNTDRIRSLGWANKMNTREALSASMTSMLDDMRAGRM